MSVIVNQELADRAERISRTQRINFGEALCQARREMADAVATVQQNVGSPLRDQQQSTSPAPVKVREAVDGGLRVLDWKRNSVGNIDAYAITLGAFEVGSRLSDLGLGPQIVSSLKGELINFLNYAFNPATGPGKPSDVIPQAADHIAAVYKQALANKVQTQVWSDGIPRYVQGVDLAHRAEKLAKQRNISFGEALSIARQEIAMASDASLTSDEIEHAISGDVQNAVNSAFNGKPKIIFESTDALKVMEAVKAAITRLDIGSLGTEPLKAAEATVNTLVGATMNAPGDVIAAKIIAAIQNAYGAAVSSAS